MDNDDNDYQGTGLHLVGEESSKVSPVLRPFTLPKFDFDVGQIRFDSLVENEVFLGIPSQEDNQWIEDFSRGSSGLEFSSGAPDSCSIRRHNNVWSEATSSETVEMLLKSVGQEEMVTGEPPVQDSDGRGELPSLTKQMDEKIDNIMDANSVEGPVEVVMEISKAGKSLDVGDAPDKCMSEAQLVDVSASRSPVDSNDTISQAVTEVTMQMSCDDSKKESVLVTESLNEQIKDDSSMAEVEVSDAGIVQDATPIIQKTDELVEVNDLHNESATALTDAGIVGDATPIIQKTDEQVGVNNMYHESATTLTDARTVPDATPVIQKTDEQVGVDNVYHESATALTDAGTVQDATPVIQKIDEQVRVSDVHHESATALTDNSITDLDAKDNFPVGEKVNDSDVTFSGDLHHDASSVENLGKSAAEFTISNDIQEPFGSKPAGNSNSATGEGPCEEKGVSADKDNNSGFTQQLGTETSVILLQSPTQCGVPTESSVARQAITQVDDVSVIKQPSLSVVDDGGVTVASLEDTNETSTIHCEHTSAPDHVSAHTEAGSADIVEELSSSHDGGGHDVLVHDKVAEDLPSDSSKLDHDSVGPLDSGKIAESPLCDVSETNLEATHGPENDSPKSNFEGEETSKMSPNTVENCPPVNSAAVLCQTAEQKSYPTNKNQKLEMEILTGAKMSSSEGITNESFHQFPDSEGQVALVDCTDEEVVHVAADQSANLVAETSDGAANVEQAVHGTSVEPSDKIEPSPAQSEPNANMNECVEGTETHGPGPEPEEPPTEKNLVAASSGVLGGGTFAESEKPNTMSGEVNDGTGRSQMDTDEQQAIVNEGKEENIPFSNGKELVAGKDPEGFIPQPQGGKVASEEEKSFTFDVSPLAGLPEEGANNSRQSISQIKAQKRSMVLDGSPSVPLSSQKDPKAVQEISFGIQQTPGKGGASKGASERKTRRGSAKSGKENARKRNSKETVPVSTGSPGRGQLLQSDVGNVEGVGANKGVVVSAPGSGLPDLNSSSQTSLIFQQPFTDQQQVQLRAQIFVYGSLIQGVAPDEACMISAFGISDVTRSWEPTWRACLERLHGQKSHPRSTETPIQLRTGSTALDWSNKQGSSQIKLVSTPVGQVSSNNSHSPANPMIPLSSPLWNMSTPSCDTHMPGNLVRGSVVDFASLSPLHPYQTQPVRNFSGHTSSWQSHTLPQSSWISSAQSPAADALLSTQPVTEALILTPIMESSVATSSSTLKHASPNLVAHGGGSSVFSATSAPPDVAKTSTQGQQSTEKRSRKRKKSSVGEHVGQSALSLALTGTISLPVTASDALNKTYLAEDVHRSVLVGQSDAAVISHTPSSSHLSKSVAVATPSNLVLESSLDKSLAALSPVPSIVHTKHESSTFEKRHLKPEDIAKVEDAKLQAEEAAGHAAIAVTHCQNVWCQLGKHKNSGLMSDIEAKIASAATAIAASASIAKAAAAAAKIASNVALHAKLMIDEALISDGTQNSTQADLITLHGLTNLGNATPASFLKVGDGNSGSSSIIFAAREAAKKKLEAASAASRHAENVEAMVKAAELAAEAVSQAGKVAAMVDPLPIAKLVEAGPEGYLKDSDFPSGKGAKLNNALGNISNDSRVQEVSDTVMDQSERPLDNELHTRDQVTSPLSKEMPRKLVEDQNEVNKDISAPVTRGGKDLRSRKKFKPSDSSKTSVVVSESETALAPTADDNVANSLNGNGGITEGCLVEVFKDNGDFTGAWFSANVLGLKGGEASVCYTDLESNEGSGKLKEWVSLGAEGNKQPRVRLAHPMTSLSFEGPRKRRRADARDITWSSGDRVDAWIENGWREGVVLEKSKKDESTLSIHFPAQGKTSDVRAWHLRPTLVWKDEEWIEWSNFRDSSKGDSPQEKRLKLGSPPVEGKGKGKLSKNTDIAETRKTEESKLLPLAADEKVFNMGTRDENKPEGLRTMRSGLQKEGSKVIFGVPKPGKKRKFMDVSKHYVSSKDNAQTDSDKLNKNIMPQGSGSSRPWRNVSRVDPKERQAADLNRPKPSLKSGRHPNLSTRTLPRKDNSNASSVSTLKGASIPGNAVKDSSSNDNKESSQQNLTGFVSSSNNEEATEEESSLSSQVARSDASKKAAATSARTERLKRGRFTPAPVKPTKVEVKEKTIPEPIEQPRRSNRRIQPTSRLLEGLQSQLTISKFPSSSRDKNQKTNRGASKGNH